MKTVLIVTGGVTPQVVTETVWKLHERGSAFMPKEICVVVTTRGEKLFEQALKPADGKLTELCRELGTDFPKVSVEVPPLGSSRLGDVRTQAEAAAYGSHVTRLVRRHARDPDTLVHVSVAGGRKTMSYYAGAALGLFGRPHDELSHVLVEPEWFEDCADYWWPYKTPRMVRKQIGRGKDALWEERDTKGSRVDMVLTPFVPLGVFLAKSEYFRQDLDYASVVSRLREMLEARRLVIDLPTHSVSFGKQVATLDAQPFALYALIATATRDRWRMSETARTVRQPDPGMISLQCLLKARVEDAEECGEHRGALVDMVYTLLYAKTGASGEAQDKLGKALAAAKARNQAVADAFLRSRRSQMAKLGKNMTRELGNPWLADRLAVRATDDGTNSWYWLAFEPHEIEIRG